MSEGVCSLSQYPVCCEQGMVIPDHTWKQECVVGSPSLGAECAREVCECVCVPTFPYPIAPRGWGFFPQGTPK